MARSSAFYATVLGMEEDRDRSKPAHLRLPPVGEVRHHPDHAPRSPGPSRRGRWRSASRPMTWTPSGKSYPHSGDRRAAADDGWAVPCAATRTATESSSTPSGGGKCGRQGGRNTTPCADAARGRRAARGGPIAHCTGCTPGERELRIPRSPWRRSGINQIRRDGAASPSPCRRAQSNTLHHSPPVRPGRTPASRRLTPAYPVLPCPTVVGISWAARGPPPIPRLGEFSSEGRGGSRLSQTALVRTMVMYRGG